ncbi:D-alanyl-D-alanine carboxypeptidase [Candidatus Uhrbacteria bacterium]|nr:D-alanyl-D-alanine carboxypeptidase [Candidatus Uhrbacteria bacterium]
MFAESFIALVGLLSVHAIQDPTTITLPLRQLPVAKYVVVLPVGVPIKKSTDVFGVAVTAKAAAVLDVASGQLLFQKDVEKTYAIASLTKLVTAMTFLDSKPSLEEEVTILPEDDPHQGKEVFINGERVSKRDLFRSLLIGSINTAAEALARSTGDRTTFIRAMNEKAKSLGMIHASFADPAGLDPNSQASARDVAIALQAALSYPEIRAVTAMNKVMVLGRVSGRSFEIKSTNLLLNSFLNKAPYQILVGKTGSLPEAGFCLAQVTRNAEGNEVIAVVLGSDNHFSRFQDAKALTYWAFENFNWPKVQARLGQLSVK